MIADVLQTNRLRLQKLAEKDAASLFPIWSDPEVTRFMNISSFATEAEAARMILLLTDLADQNRAVRYGVIHRDTGRIIGSCGFNTLDFENEKAEIGYEIDRACWGQGYGPEAITGLTAYAFEQLGFMRVEAKTEPENTNSVKALQKCGFMLEGVLRKSEKVQDAFIDLAVYARIRL